MIAVAAEEGVRVFELKTLSIVRQPRGHQGCVNVVAFSPDSRQLASGGDDGTVQISRLDAGRPPRKLIHPKGLSDLAWSRDGRRVFSGCDDGGVRIWDANDGRLLQVLSGHTGDGIGLSFNIDGTRLVTSSHDGAIALWEMTSGRRLNTLRPASAPVERPVFSPDGTRIISAHQDGTLRVWHTQSGREMLSIPGSIFPGGIDLSPDGLRLVASGRYQPALRIWDAAWDDGEQDTIP
jgi:WD40 repeat protein